MARVNSRISRAAACAALAAGLSACGASDRLAARSMRDVLLAARPAQLDEPDFDLAREAAPAQLEMVRALLASAPRDRGLLRMAEEGFAGAAFLFYEDVSPARAKGLYRRGRDYALRALALKPGLRGLDAMTPDAAAKALALADGDDAPDLFWAAFCWAGEINLSRDDPARLAELPRALALMTRAEQLDAGYHFHGADLFFGVYYASRPAILGGDPKRALAHFESARKALGGRYLMTDVLEARWYAVAVQDKDLYRRLLESVVQAPAGSLPEARLTDEAAKRKAAALLEKTDDYF